VHLFEPHGECEVGRIQLSAKLVKNRGVAEQVVYDSLLDGGYWVGASGNMR